MSFSDRAVGVSVVFDPSVAVSGVVLVLATQNATDPTYPAELKGPAVPAALSVSELIPNLQPTPNIDVTGPGDLIKSYVMNSSGVLGSP